jgi:hypothetical protein
MADLAAPMRPTLTLPPAEAAALQEAYAQHRVILEYGSGGSTVVAGERAEGVIFSVESDANWLADMARWFDVAPPVSTVHLHHADVGPTRAWGFPTNRKFVAKWPDYALSVWDRPDFEAPDLVLVDGRFRLACMLTTQFGIERPTVLLVDDYVDRPGYHRFETLAGAPTLIGRMARFDLSPRPMPPEALEWIASSYTDPN